MALTCESSAKNRSDFRDFPTGVGSSKVVWAPVRAIKSPIIGRATFRHTVGIAPIVMPILDADGPAANSGAGFPANDRRVPVFPRLLHYLKIQTNT